MISVVIVGYNSKNDLKTCLSSVYKSTYKQFRVIFVDNSSSDGSVEFVRTKYPKVDIISNKNSGFAGGGNIGIKRAIKLKTDYIFLLNPDVTIEPDCFKKLIARIDQKTILQPLILLNIKGKNTHLVNTTGDYLNFLGFCYCNDYRADQTAIKEKDIVIASGAAALIPIGILETIGLLDKNFFMYHEDADLFYRAHLYGFNIKLMPNALAWHQYSFSRNKGKMFYADRNRLLFLYKNFSSKYLILILPMMIINEVLMIVYSLFSGWFLKKIQVYFSVLSLLKSSSIQRRKNLPYIKKREREIKRFIGAEISFSEIKSPLFTPYNLILKIYWALIKPLI
jgi:hypothetical protein